MHQLRKAPVQGVQCHPAGCHHHAPGHCTRFKPEKTPGECAPSKQRRKKQKQWSKPKKKKMQDPRNRERKSQKGKGHSQDQSRGRSRDNTARGCRPGNELPRQNRGVQEQFLRNLLKLMHYLMRVIWRKTILRGY
ncbi:unnamed protein product [Rangifer tarandus platyrhynchus]|uniref:Uncharacterized protein n=2 Tax=Rangifer tarandus platyrhynchus TaxID=3082113 RepID=A0ACB0DUI2_RANTA|nr:unnamed protein product [Rangifer tarandus platyrhynchus]CAI9691809.1 unnamed protein product [Rangifer tarandus platyrhynchus]